MHNNYLLVMGVVQEEGINTVLFDGVLSDWTLVLLLNGVQWGLRLQVKSSHGSEQNGFKRLMTPCALAAPRGPLYSGKRLHTCRFFFVLSWKGDEAEN